MGIPGLIQELGAGDRVSLAKLAIDHLQETSRPLRIAIDISIWLFQAQAAQGGSKPELRALFYRLARLVALPIHPIFVFDGPERPEYKRGKLVVRNASAGGRTTRSAKQLIELFGFHYHDAPGEAEAECAKLQKEGVVDVSMSNDIDTIMFGSRLTYMNFSRVSSRSPSAATHVNVYRADGSEANVTFDVGGMVLFALLSGGDYLPAGVSKCGPKLAAEIARAGFGADLLDVIKGNPKDVKTSLNEWRERLEYELHTNESGYFRCKHKAVRIPDKFPDLRVLSDYTNPVTSSTKDLRALQTLQWDRELDINALREFAAVEFGWNYLPGAIEFVRKLAPSLASYNLRVRSQNQFHAQICGRKENLAMDGLAELKLQFAPVHAVGLDLTLEEEPSSQAQNLDSDGESDPEDGQTEPSSSAAKRTPYDPTKEQKFWIFEALVTLGMPEAVKNWYDEQEQKRLAALKPALRRSTRKSKKTVDSGMAPGALHRYGTVVKAQAKISSGTGKATEPSTAGKRVSKPANASGGRRDSGANRSQRTLADCAAFAVRNSKAGASSFSGEPKPPRKLVDPTSSDIEAAMTLDLSQEGRLPPTSSQQKGSNHSHSPGRAVGGLEPDSEVIFISSSPPEDNYLQSQDTTRRAKGKAKATKPAVIEEKPGPSSTNIKARPDKSRLPSLDGISNSSAHDTIKKSSQRDSRPAIHEETNTISLLSDDDDEDDDDAQEIFSQAPEFTQSTPVEAPPTQLKHIDLANIDIGNGFWKHAAPNIGSQTSRSSANNEDERSNLNSSRRVSILDLTG